MGPPLPVIPLTSPSPAGQPQCLIGQPQSSPASPVLPGQPSPPWPAQSRWQHRPLRPAPSPSARSMLATDEVRSIVTAGGPAPGDAEGMPVTTMQRWLEAACAELGIDPGTADARTILDVARYVAHQVPRPPPPLRYYQLGVAVGRGQALRATALRLTALASDWPAPASDAPPAEPSRPRPARHARPPDPNRLRPDRYARPGSTRLPGPPPGRGRPASIQRDSWLAIRPIAIYL